MTMRRDPPIVIIDRRCDVTVDGASRRYPDVEVGGIIIGKLSDDRNEVIIAELCPPPPDSLMSRSQFTRGISGVEATIRSAQSNGLSYLGEWHTHPSQLVVESQMDADAMKKLSLDLGGTPIMAIYGQSFYAATPPRRFWMAWPSGLVELKYIMM
jgi:integrative and conjugative element protein (TIGR02256 family)